ncbi:hypothetical protein [Streptomyces heilongjiangensis]|uniref:Uncharacterized protein n=1 Tax=Streptomyces heilongjiangensis TaxID=945052 RepID=A0ABW1B3M1_9ACTN|nr:hypothetical protein [Streptomyces heilongjiangensis]MDC2952475.1 hypothetical protein [Streptomyces heilongjiangensis]
MTNSVRHTTGNFLGLMATPASACAQDARPRVTVDPTHPRVDDATRITHKSGALYIATCAYTEALATKNPAATLDGIADSLNDVMPQVFATLGTSEELAAALLPEIKNLVWAFNAIEYARAEAAEHGCGYLFDYLAELLKNGADPQRIRTDALAAPRRLRELAEQAGGDR